MIDYILALLAITILHALMRKLDEPEDKKFDITSDGHRYLHMGRGCKGYKPFHRRWLLPYLLKDNEQAWKTFTYTCTILLPLATFTFLTVVGLSPLQSLFGSLLVLGLPAVFKFNLYFPILVDAPSHLFTLLSASSFVHGNLGMGLFLIVVGGCIKESVPVFSILFQLPFIGLNPLALLGLISPLYTTFFKEQATKDVMNEEQILNHPIKSGIKTHRGMWFNMERMLLPWGVCLIALFNVETLPYLLLVLTVAYGQLFISWVDTQRHYQVAFPLMVAITASIVPESYYIPLLIIHWFNPWQRHMA